MTPLLSIVTISFNDEHGLALTLDSVYNFCASNSSYLFQLVIIEKASSYSKRYLECHNPPSNLEVNTYQQTDSGIYFAFNQALHFVSSPWVIFINSSDALLDSSHWIHTLYRHSPKSVSLISFQAQLIGSNNNVLGVQPVRFYPNRRVYLYLRMLFPYCLVFVIKRFLHGNSTN